MPVLQTGTFLDTVVPLLGLTVGQLLQLIGIAVGVVVAGLLVRGLLRAIFRRTAFPEDMESRVARGSLYLVVLIGLVFVPATLGINLGIIILVGIPLSTILTVLLLAITFYLAAWLASGILIGISRRVRYTEEVQKGLGSVARLVVYVIGIFVIFWVLGTDLTALLLSLGAFSIALSFALVDIIKNVTSGLLIQADRPFRPGDTIVVGGIEGRVLRTKIRTTVLETAEGHLAYIPNLWFTTKDIINKTRRQEPEPVLETDDSSEA
ncbi:MAG: mechanosensitive ion channel family protein [Thermoplasmata archaeon]